MGAHVDDMIWAAAPEHEHLVTEELLGRFELNKIEEEAQAIEWAITK